MTDKELYTLCQKYGKNARIWARKFAALLPEVQKRRLYKKHKFYSIYHFAAVIGGLSQKVVDEVLRTHEVTKNTPILQAQIETQGWGKVRAVAKITTQENEKEMVKLVKTMTKPSLEQYARDMKIQSTNDVKIPTRVEKFTNMNFKVDSDTEFRFQEYRQRLEKERGKTVTLNETLKALLDGAKEKPKEPRKTKPTKTTRNIQAKTKENLSKQCTFPGCKKPATTIHHPERFAIRKSHENLTPLCKSHHQIAHAGLIENEELPPKTWKLRTEPEEGTYKAIIDQTYQKYQGP